jgi:hypothetical protein
VSANEGIVFSDGWEVSASAPGSVGNPVATAPGSDSSIQMTSDFILRAARFGLIFPVTTKAHYSY